MNQELESGEGNVKLDEYNFSQIDPEIYTKALDLKESLGKALNGNTLEMAICYTLVNAIENLKKELEELKDKK